MRRGLLFLFFLMTIGVADSRAQVKLMDMPHLQKRIANKDTLYVVNFWATWCSPCVAELPNFSKLQKTYAQNKVKVILISMDFKSKLQTEVTPFVRKNKIPLEVYLASRTDDQAWISQIDKNWSGALPGTLIINNKKGIHKFYEKDFSFEELNKLYQTSK